MIATERILSTKIQIPPLPPQTIRRGRLFDALDVGLQPNVRITLISAPAGYGKTTLLSEWILDRGYPSAWLTLDEGDNDPIRFFSYLLAALERGIPSLEIRAPSVSQLAEGEIQEHVLIPLLNEIAQPITPTLLVLDDYHFIHNQNIHDGMSYLIDHLPPQAHILMATRADPPLQITRLRGRGQVNELRMEDLRFRVEEVNAFLNTFSGLALSAGDIQSLTHRTEGWISGLRMAVASLQGRKDHTGFIQEFSGSHRHIMDYLIDEVLDLQPSSLEAFLLHTSILPRMCASLCDALMETVSEASSPSQNILMKLESANLFIIPLDTKCEWYRYHRLFSDLLQARLQLKYPARIPALHLRAGQWFEANHMKHEAIQHALQGHHAAYAADLIERTAQETLMRGETNTFLRWLQRLPEGEILNRPKLGIYRAWALLWLGAPLASIEAQLQRSRKEGGPPGSSLSLQSFIAMLQGKITYGLELAERALQDLPEDEIYLRDFATFCAASARISAGDVETGMQMMMQTSRASQRSGNRIAAVMILVEMAELYIKQLEWEKSQELYEQALTLSTDEQGELLPIAGQALIGLGDLALERYELESAESLLQQGIELCERWSLLGALNGHLSLTMLYELRGDRARVQHSIDTLHNLAQRFDATEFDDIIVDMLAAQVNVRLGELEAVNQWAVRRGLEDFPDQKPPLYTEEFLSSRIYKYELPILARLHIAEKRYYQALEVIQELIPLAQEANRPYLQIQAEILKACTLQTLGEAQDAFAALQRALELAEPSQAIRVFLGEGEQVVRLLEASQSRWDSAALRQFTYRLLRIAGSSKVKDIPATQGLLEPLSPRELEILRLLPSSLTANELAQELIISVNTVRSHLKSIYSKMGVHSRHEAVARGTELDLL